jgi:hypothetical protein
MRDLRAAVLPTLILLSTNGMTIHAQPSVRGNGAVVNRVIDLLNEDVALAATGGQAPWVSSPFDTSQFYTIGIRFSAETPNSRVTCRVSWRFAPDDAFLPGGPAMTLGSPVVSLDYLPGSGDYGAWGNQQRTTPPSLPGEMELPGHGRSSYPPHASWVLVPGERPTSFADVHGTSARVECSVSPLVEYVQLGDDATLPTPDAIPPTATLTDVKVLLRR